MRALAVACAQLFVACKNRADRTATLPHSNMPTYRSWVLRICNDTQLEIVHLFGSEGRSAELLADSSLGSGACTPYVGSDQPHRALNVTFLVGDSDQFHF